jgi:hypothetical protein
MPHINGPMERKVLGPTSGRMWMSFLYTNQISGANLMLPNADMTHSMMSGICVSGDISGSTNTSKYPHEHLE